MGAAERAFWQPSEIERRVTFWKSHLDDLLTLEVQFVCWLISNYSSPNAYPMESTAEFPEGNPFYRKRAGSSGAD
jgi:hypothetical protein